MKPLTDKIKDSEFPSWWKNPIWLYIKDYIKNKLILVGIGIFILYQVIPYIATLFYSSPDDHIYLITSGHEPMSCLNDTAHIIFAIALSIGGMTMFYIFNQIPVIINKLSKEKVINAHLDRIKEKYLLNRKIANSIYLKILSLILMSITAIVFFKAFYLPEYDYWWGNIKYGYLNIYHVFLEMALIYYGTQTVFLLIFNTRFILQIINFGLTPKIFHQDNSNGLSPLGKIIMLNWIISLVLISCVFIVLFFRYLGLESSFLVLLIILIFTLVIPVIAVLPLLKSLSEISKIKKAKLKIFGKLLNNELDLIERLTIENNTEGVKSHVTSFVEKQQIFDTINRMNIFPFNPKALASVIIIYSVQVGITVYQLVIS